MSVLLYGRNRIGKTTLACQFPKPLALLSLEPSKTGGAKSVKGVSGVMSAVIRKTEDLHKIAVELATTGHGYKTVVLDSVSSLEKIVLMEIMGWDAPVEQLRVGKSSPVQTEHYTDRSERMKTLIRPFLNLDGVNVVILANEKDHNPPKNEGGERRNSFNRGMQDDSYFAADTGAGMAKWLMDSSDFILQMHEDAEVRIELVEIQSGQPKVEVHTPTGKRIRRLRLGYHPQYAAGARVDQYSSGKTLPEFIDGKTPAELYANFRKAIS